MNEAETRAELIDPALKVFFDVVTPPVETRERNWLPSAGVTHIVASRDPASSDSRIIKPPFA